MSPRDRVEWAGIAATACGALLMVGSLLQNGKTAALAILLAFVMGGIAQRRGERAKGL